jgi:hypothetical protein
MAQQQNTDNCLSFCYCRKLKLNGDEMRRMNDTAVTFNLSYWHSLPGVTETMQECGMVSGSPDDIKMGTSVCEAEMASTRQRQCKHKWKAVTLTYTDFVKCFLCYFACHIGIKIQL